LKDRFRSFPKEIWPDNGIFRLSEDIGTVQEEMKRCRKDEKAWPSIHYLWPLNPVVEWLNDKLAAEFGRHEAPALVLGNRLAPDEVLFIMSGLIPNRKSHPLVHRWFGVVFRAGRLTGIEEFGDILDRTGLGKEPVPNPGRKRDVGPLVRLLPKAVAEARKRMSRCRDEFKEAMDIKLDEQLDRLGKLQERQYKELEKRFSNAKQPEGPARRRIERERRRIDQVFEEYVDWVTNTMEVEKTAYIRVVAVLTGSL
jgi:hypothetical protein